MAGPGTELSIEEGEVESTEPTLPPWADFLSRLAAIAILLGLAALVVAKEVESGSAAFAAGAVVVALILLALPLARLAEIRSLKLWGVGFELERADAAMGHAPTAELTVELDDPRQEQESDREATDLQLLLEAKLAYIAKHVIGFEARGHWSTYLSVGSLQYDGYLSRSDAIAARRLLGLRPGDLRFAQRKARKDYLRKARSFVRSVRATIFEGVVRRVIERDLKTDIYERPRPAGKRPDFELRLSDGERLLVFPAFAGGGGYWTHKRIHDRAVDLASSSERALIVVPPNIEESIEPAVPGVALAKLDDLVRAGRTEGRQLTAEEAQKRLLELMPPADTC